MSPVEIAYYFQNRWTSAERQTALALMERVDQVLKDTGIEYLVYGGTLLSYMRGQRLLGYDDDIDFVIHSLVFPEHLLSKLNAYDLAASKHPTQNLYKVYFTSSHNLEETKWGFPFVDIAFGYIEGEYFCHDSVYGGVDRFPLSDVFPLRRDTIEGVMVSIPANPTAVCVAKYSQDCLTSALPPSWDHKLARPTGFPQIRVPLDEIAAVLKHDSK